MKTYVLDAARFSDADAFYDEASSAFGFPDYFGRNLDALADCLSDVATPCRIVWLHTDADKLDADFRESVFAVFRENAESGVEFVVTPSD
ncbi:MAG: Barstar protein [Patescibacteria group bacterium]|nr:Barstar protein [Patescibacteria group bacterium]